MTPEILAALIGLPPMPRTPLTINPCPDGYSLQLSGGQFTCVLEGADGESLLEMQRAQMMNRQVPQAAPSSPFQTQGGIQTTP